MANYPAILEANDTVTRPGLDAFVSAAVSKYETRLAEEALSIVRNDADFDSSSILIFARSRTLCSLVQDRLDDLRLSCVVVCSSRRSDGFSFYRNKGLSRLDEFSLRRVQHSSRNRFRRVIFLTAAVQTKHLVGVMSHVERNTVNRSSLRVVSTSDTSCLQYNQALALARKLMAVSLFDVSLHTFDSNQEQSNGYTSRPLPSGRFHYQAIHG